MLKSALQLRSRISNLFKNDIPRKRGTYPAAYACLLRIHLIHGIPAVRTIAAARRLLKRTANRQIDSTKVA